MERTVEDARLDIRVRGQPGYRRNLCVPGPVADRNVRCLRSCMRAACWHRLRAPRMSALLVDGIERSSSKSALGLGLFFGSLICWSALQVTALAIARFAAVSLWPCNFNSPSLLVACPAQMKDRGPGVRGYPFVIALVLSWAVFCLAARRFMDTGKYAMGLIAAASFFMGMRYTSHFTIYGDLYEYGI